MKPRFLPGLLAVAVVLGASLPTRAGTKRIELPAESAVLRPSPLPGYAKAQANCVACHSAEYMQYQPAGAARPYWEAMTRRMKTVFLAPIAEEDIAPIVDYLVRTYGNEQPR